MGRPVVPSILALLLASALSHNSNGEANAAGQIEHTKQLDEYQVSLVENSIARIIRDAKIKSGRNGKNKKKADKERNKSRNAKKNMTKNKKKMGRNRKNRMKLKNKGKKNKKQLSKTMKIRTKKGKKSRNKNNKLKKENKKPRQNKKKSRQKQKSKQNKKKLRTTGGKIFQGKKNKNDLSKWKPKQACDEVALCQKIKDYIKISNQLRKVRRILKSCDTMDRKAKKSASEFEATVGALETAIGSSSGRRMYRSRWRRATESKDDVTSIKDKLKNCSKTAKAKCQKSSVAPCQEEANLTKCETELQGWLTLFGPSKGSCLQESSDCCTCITALPDVSKDCLAFDKKSTLAVESKKKCTGGDEEGSFGFCRKLQIEAAEKGPKHAKDNCKHPGPGSMTTKGPWPSGKHCGECSNTLECPPTCPFCDLDPGSGLFGKCYKFPVTSLTSTYTPCSKCPECGNATSSGCDKKCSGNMTCCSGNDPVGECGCCIPKGTHCKLGKGGTCSQIATTLVTASNPSCVNGVCMGDSKCCKDVCCPLNWYCSCWGCWNPHWGLPPVCPGKHCGGNCAEDYDCGPSCPACVINGASGYCAKISEERPTCPSGHQECSNTTECIIVNDRCCPLWPPTTQNFGCCYDKMENCPTNEPASGNTSVPDRIHDDTLIQSGDICAEQDNVSSDANCDSLCNQYQLNPHGCPRKPERRCLAWSRGKIKVGTNGKCILFYGYSASDIVKNDYFNSKWNIF